jgi:hypothetical protein
VFGVEKKKVCYRKMIEQFIDQHGYIIHYNDKMEINGMDSCQRTYSFELCTESNIEDFKTKVCKIWDIANNRFIRHPDLKHGNSRDQMKALIFACAFHGWTFPMDAIAGNFYRAYNTTSIDPLDTRPRKPDFILPTIIWGADIRCRRATKFGDYTLLNLFDFVDLFNTLVLCVKSWFHPNETSSDLNQINEHIFKHRTVKTPISLLQRFIYKHLRSAPAIHKRGANKFTSILHVYFWHKPTMPPMYDVYQTWIDKLL